MRITEDQYKLVEGCFPVQRGNVKLSNLVVLNALLYITENGCKWRALPEKFGKWSTVYRRVRRWAEKGILDKVLSVLHDIGVIEIDLRVLSLDSTITKVHPDGTGALKSNRPQSIGKSRGGWTTKIHAVASDDKTAVAFKISPGQDHDAPIGRELINELPKAPEIIPDDTVQPESDQPEQCCVTMDRTYEGDETRSAVEKKGYKPVVPPKKNRKEPWEYDKETYKRRNEVERLFRRLKAYRRIFTRYDKLDTMYILFVIFGLINEALRIA